MNTFTVPLTLTDATLQEAQRWLQAGGGDIEQALVPFRGYAYQHPDMIDSLLRAVLTTIAVLAQRKA